MADYEVQFDAPRLPRTTVSMSMKVNLGNYESAEAFMSITVDPTTTIQEIHEALDGPARIAYDALKARLAERVAALRRKE